MKVRIENNGSASITVKGRHTIRIPEHGVFEAELPDTPQIRNVISRLRREYPALKIIIANDEAKPAQNIKTGGDESQPQGDATPQGDGQPQEPSKNAGPMEKDAFVAQAKASRAAGNKWNVKIDSTTFELLEAADKAAAIEAAYALYAESFSNPSQGEDKQ
ncbi:MAG: hypothetical protein OSJ28_11060 [Desulfovibrio sp.]|nr:hypothetical protein [Desulfovibrio sp.]